MKALKWMLFFGSGFVIGVVCGWLLFDLVFLDGICWKTEWVKVGDDFRAKPVPAPCKQ